MRSGAPIAPAEPRGADDSSGWSRPDRENWTIARGRDADHPAVGGHHLHRRMDADCRQTVGELRKIAAHRRQQIGVHHCGRGALIFLDLRQHLTGCRHQKARRACAQNGSGAPLMHIVGVGVEEADRHGLHPLRRKESGRGADTGLVERRDYAAIGANPLGGFQPPAARHQRLRLAPGEVEHARRADTRDFQDVAKAARRQQTRARTSLLQDRVRRHGRSMHHLGDIVRIKPRLGQERGNARRYAFARIERCCCRFVDVDSPVGQRQHHIGEGAADVDADARQVLRLPTTRCHCTRRPALCSTYRKIDHAAPAGRHHR